MAINHDGSVSACLGAVDGRMSQAPAQWKRLPDTKKFLESLKKKLDVGKSYLIKSVRGRGKAQGTYAHWQIALAYAKYLSPEFHIWANEKIKQAIEFELDPEKGVTICYTPGGNQTMMKMT